MFQEHKVMLTRHTELRFLSMSKQCQSMRVLPISNGYDKLSKFTNAANATFNIRVVP